MEMICLVLFILFIYNPKSHFEFLDQFLNFLKRIENTFKRVIHTVVEIPYLQYGLLSEIRIGSIFLLF